jgi:phosphonate transport system substrate-binding protein
MDAGARGFRFFPNAAVPIPSQRRHWPPFAGMENRMLHSVRRMLFAVLSLCLASPAGAAEPATAESLILAVHPYLPPKELVTRFTPLAEYLGRELGRPVSVRVGRDYDEHSEAIGKDSVDIAFLGPAPYTRVVARYGKKPLLARLEIKGQPTFRGTIVTRTDSPLRTLAELKGKRFAFGDPNSTMSHLVPEYLLLKAGVRRRDLTHYQFLGAHNNVALAVLAGDFDAGAVKDEVFRDFAPKGLRALSDTPAISEHLFVTRSTFPPELIDPLRQALLRLKDIPAGMTIMQAINKDMTAMVAVTDSDYDNLRAILKTLEARRD